MVHEVQVEGITFEYAEKRFAATGGRGISIWRPEAPSDRQTYALFPNPPDPPEADRAPAPFSAAAATEIADRYVLFGVWPAMGIVAVEGAAYCFTQVELHF